MLATASFEVEDGVRKVCKLPFTRLKGASASLVKSTVSIVDELFGVMLPAIDELGDEFLDFFAALEAKIAAAPSVRRVSDASPKDWFTDLRFLLASIMAL